MAGVDYLSMLYIAYRASHSNCAEANSVCRSDFRSCFCTPYINVLSSTTQQKASDTQTPSTRKDPPCCSHRSCTCSFLFGTPNTTKAPNEPLTPMMASEMSGTMMMPRQHRQTSTSVSSLWVSRNRKQVITFWLRTVCT